MLEWIFTVLVALAPPERYARAQAFPGWEETTDQRIERYRSIAADLDAVVAEDAGLFRGPAGKKQTVALVLAAAHHETGFAKDADVGPCYRGLSGKNTRCDSGRAACLMQLHGSPDELRELFTDRKRCFREGIARLKRSLGACRELPALDRLAAYASGNCHAGFEESRAILNAAQRAFSVQ